MYGVSRGWLSPIAKTQKELKSDEQVLNAMNNILSKTQKELKGVSLIH